MRRPDPPERIRGFLPGNEARTAHVQTTPADGILRQPVMPSQHHRLTEQPGLGQSGNGGRTYENHGEFSKNRENVILRFAYPSNRKIDWGCRFACASIAVPVWTRMVLLVKFTISSAISASLMRDSAAWVFS